MAGGMSDETQGRLRDLVSFPREDLETELKGWLDIWTRDNPSKESQSNLAQAILALANHGGGQILIGFGESGGTWFPDPNRPVNLNGYTQDIVNGIVQRFAEPSFHCQLHHVLNSQTGEVFPVIVVPGGHRVPIRAKASGTNDKHIHMNCYYIRRPGPKSEQIQTAHEWEALIARCVRMAKEELIDDIRSLLYGFQVSSNNAEQEAQQQFENWIIEADNRFQSLVKTLGPKQHPGRYQHGFWTFSYKVDGDFQPPSLSDLKDKMDSVEGRTGWPAWIIFNNRQELKPYPYGDLIECWLKDAHSSCSSNSDFWRASPDGKFYLLRGYDDDCTNAVEAGKYLDAYLPIWRIGECLLHAESMARVLGTSSDAINIQVRWTGLAGRQIVSWTEPARSLYHEEECKSQTVSSSVRVTAENIGSALPEVTESLLRPLYDAFGFLKMPLAVIQHELNRMKNRQ